MPTIREEAREIEVRHECDVCVIGGSCTGVFAAVRAARLGRSVVLVEQANAFGGMATGGLVCVWHSLQDTEHSQQIIGGLSAQVLDRLRARGAATPIVGGMDDGTRFNPQELKIELDRLVLENRITPLLHTSFCQPVVKGGEVQAVLIENKDGRSAVRAGVYVDATGDGDLFARAGIPFTVRDHPQPPTTCALIRDFWIPGLDFRAVYNAHHAEFGLEPDAGWHCLVPGLRGMHMVAQTHVSGAQCADAESLTRAEMEGRRQIRAVIDMIRKYGPQQDDIALVALASHIGVRETRHIEAEYCLTEEDVLSGKRFDDAIARGSYRVDVHPPEGGGFVLKYLDGTMETITPEGCERGRWREARAENPTHYHIPYRTMVNGKLKNAIMAGRMMGADAGAFGAIRVMVNLNQVGEAAGVAAHLALENQQPVCEVEGSRIRRLLDNDL